MQVYPAGQVVTGFVGEQVNPAGQFPFCGVPGAEVQVHPVGHVITTGIEHVNPAGHVVVTGEVHVKPAGQFPFCGVPGVEVQVHPIGQTTAGGGFVGLVLHV